MCHKAGAVVCIDGTFATPINQRAIADGADLILHSATKYIAGHNDVLCGALCGSEKLVQEVRKYHHVLGGVVDSVRPSRRLADTVILFFIPGWACAPRPNI